MLADVLEEAATDGDGRYRCLPSGGGPRPLRELWERSAGVACWLQRRAGAHGTVAAVLSSSEASLSFVVGAIRAGVTLLSLPRPAPSDDLAWYARLVEDVCAAQAASVLLVDRRYEALAAALPIPVTAFEDATAAGVPLPADPGGSLVQFTSGSTADPRGVVLSHEGIAAHLEALLEVIDPRPGDVSCSWLPLSHDMGLFGLALAPWAAGRRRWAGEGSLVLIEAEAYARDPGIWLRTCAQLGATITAAPPRAYRAAALQLEREPDLRPGSLRICIVGAEPIDPRWLRAFDEAMASRGGARTRLCPGYGLAEATLAVTLTPPEVPWTSTRIARSSLAGSASAGPAVRLAGDLEVVGCGRPVPGTEISLATPGAPSAIRFRSSHRATGYAGDPPWRPDAWHTTQDLGVLESGQLFVIGRLDDVVFCNGANVHLADVDAVLARALPRHAPVAVPATDRTIDVVVEAAGDPGTRSIPEVVRERVGETFGIGVARVFTPPKHSLPRTPSGKVKRRAARERIARGVLDAHA